MANQTSFSIFRGEWRLGVAIAKPYRVQRRDDGLLVALTRTYAQAKEFVDSGRAEAQSRLADNSECPGFLVIGAKGGLPYQDDDSDILQG